MSQSIASINALLVDIKTVNNGLLVKLQQAGFNTSLQLGHESEYTVKSLVNHTDNLIIHFLTITANREQFIQRTSYTERKDMQSILKKMFISFKETHNSLHEINQNQKQIINDIALCYLNESNEPDQLALIHSIDFIDMLKPYCRMLELLIAQERIVALSAVLETMLHKDPSSRKPDHEEDVDLTDEQNNALELSHYLVKQAL